MAIGQQAAVLDGVRRIFEGGTAAASGPDSLLRRFARTGDEAAFAAIVARHGPMVLAVCRRALRDPHDVEDAFQATFLVFVRRAGSIRDGEALGAWLHGVARRVAVRRGPWRRGGGTARGRAWRSSRSRRRTTRTGPRSSRWSTRRSTACPSGTGGRSSSATSRAAPSPRPPAGSAGPRARSADGWRGAASCSSPDCAGAGSWPRPARSEAWPRPTRPRRRGWASL